MVREVIACGMQQNMVLPLDQITVIEQVRQDKEYGGGDTALQELAASIEQHGLLNPLTVAAGADGVYTLIAGQRRLEAAKMIGLSAVPVVAVYPEDGASWAIQIAENIHRSQLNPIDEGRRYLAACFDGASAEDIAQQVNKPVRYVHARIGVYREVALRNAIENEQMGLAAAQSMLTVMPWFTQGGVKVLAHEALTFIQCLERGGCLHEEDVRGVRWFYTEYRVLHDAAAHKAWIDEHPLFWDAYKKYTDVEWLLRRGTGPKPNEGAGLGLYRDARDAEEAQRGREKEALPAPSSSPVAPAPPVTMENLVGDALHPETQPKKQGSAAPISYSVDKGGMVAVVEPPVSPTPRIMEGPSAEKVVVAPRPPEDPDAMRVRCLMGAVEKTSRESVLALLRLGAERGWSCGELQRRIGTAYYAAGGGE